MHTLKQKQQKYRQQIKQQQKQIYYSQIRNSLLAATENQFLDQILEASLVRDQLLLRLRHHGLLRILHQAIDQQGPQQIEYVAVICANLLLDNLTLEEIQQTAKICQKAINKIPQNYELATCSSLSHAAHCLFIVLKQISEDQSIEYETNLFRVLSNIISSISSIEDQSLMMSNASNQNHMLKISKKLIECLGVFFDTQPQYLGQIEGKFKRNCSFFLRLFSYHHYSILNGRNAHHLILHEGLLQIYELLVKCIQIRKYPFMFQNGDYLNIILYSILSKSTQLNRLGLEIMIIMLIEYRQAKDNSLNYHLTRLLKNERQKELVNQVLDRTNVDIKVEFIKEILGQQQNLKEWVNQYWQTLLNYLCDVIKQPPNINTLRVCLEAILLYCYDNSKQANRPLRYLINIGFEYLLDNVGLYLQEGQDDENNETISGIIGELTMMIGLDKSESI